MEDRNFVEFIISCLKDIVSEQGEGVDISLKDLNESTKLIGRNSVLDSLGLVSLLVDVEQKLFDLFDISITIADERAMSQEKSPFLTIGTLSDYVKILVREEEEKIVKGNI